MTEAQRRVNTSKYINGHWYGEGEMRCRPGTIKVALSIDENVVLSIYHNGRPEKVSPFSSTAHWVKDFLSFMDNRKFFIKYANETQMEFGELEKAGNFNRPIKWMLTLNRVA